METRNHLKNGVQPKNQMSRRYNFKKTADIRLTQTVSCKHCGKTVLLEIHCLSPNTTGGATTNLCKCGRVSSYVFTLREGRLIELR